MPTIALLGTMDTKGVEHAYIADLIRARGHEVLVIDVGSLDEPKLAPDVSRAEVAAAAGVDFAGLAARRDRGESVANDDSGCAGGAWRSWQHEGRIQGVISLGGGGGTAIGTAAMRELAGGISEAHGVDAGERERGAVRGGEGHRDVSRALWISPV
jgi:uncharacterized protein (UPF0261 family)